MLRNGLDRTRFRGPHRRARPRILRVLRPGGARSRRLPSLLLWMAGCIAMLLVPWQAASAAQRELAIGSKRFTESYLLGEILTQTAALAGPARHVAGMGNTAILFSALRAGSIDAYPEYSGTVAAEILKLPAGASSEQMRTALADQGIGMAIPLGFQNTYALAVREDATPLHRLSDLRNWPNVRVALSHEFLGRADGWPGLAARYGLPQRPAGLDHGLAYEALANRQVDVIDIYSTDAKIRKYGLRVLADDGQFFPRYDALVLYRLDLPERFPHAWAELQGLAGRIRDTDMIRMNAAAEIEGQSFAAVASEFLTGRSGGQGGARRDGVPGTLFSAETLRLAVAHLGLVGGAVGAATLVGVPLGILAARRRRLGRWVIAAAGVLQTIPSLALLALLIPLLGRIGAWPALMALFLYALLPIVTNTCEGLLGIRQGLRDAAYALGMTARQRLRLVELPLATPVMLAGIRTAAVISVGTATIAAFVGAGGFGERIVMGLALNDDRLLIAGAVPAAVLAILIDMLFVLGFRRPRGRAG